MVAIVGRLMTKARFLAGLAGLVGLVAASSACSKDDPPPSPAAPAAAALDTAPASPSAGAPAAPSSTASSGASLAQTAAPAASASPSDTTRPVASASEGAAPPRASGAAPAKAALTCGDRPLPACPLNAWMKANTSPAIIAEDFDGLAAAFEKVVGFAPEGYPNWASISRDGADAARAQSLDGAKAACRGCHTQYKDKYKRELRDRPI
jgi:hypothetical protein